MPAQPGVSAGDGLADWEMHQNIGLDLPVESLQMQIGPALFSYIFGSWQQVSAGPAPGATARFPGFAAGSQTLDLTAIATAASGAATVAAVQPLCLSGAAEKQVQQAVAAYGNAATAAMLVPAVWNLPADYRSGQYFKGALDENCSTAGSSALGTWCDWMRWNLPGPLAATPIRRCQRLPGYRFRC